MFKEKKLYRSTNKMIGGVCAGIAEYLEIDPTIVRVVYALLSLFTAGFGGTIVYIVLYYLYSLSLFHLLYQITYLKFLFDFPRAPLLQFTHILYSYSSSA